VLANDTDADAADTLTVSAKTNGSNGTVTIEAGNTTVKYVPNAGFFGTDTFTYTVSDGVATDVGTVTVYVRSPFTWTGASTGPVSPNWSVGANWHGGTAPNGTQTAVFDGTCQSNCSPTINQNISVGGIRINTGYTGTITQGATYTVTIGSSGYYQAAGTFDGADGAITTQNFTLAGGTFNSTSGILKIASDSSQTAFNMTAGTFTHRNGTVTFDSTVGHNNHVINVDVALTLYNLRYTSSAGLSWEVTRTINPGDSLTVANEFRIDRTGSAGLMTSNGGTINVEGSAVVGAGAKGGDTIVAMIGTSAANVTGVASAYLPHLKIDKSGAGSVTASANLGAYYFTLAAGTFTAPSGTLTIFNNNPATVFTHTGGTFAHNNGTVAFTGEVGHTTTTIDLNSTLTLYNVNFNTAAGLAWAQTRQVAAGDTLVVDNDFRLERTGSSGTVAAAGTIEVGRNVFVGTGAGGGSAAITMTGATPAIIEHASGTFPTGALTVNKPASSAALSANLTLSGGGQNLSVSAGELQLDGYNLTVPGTLSAASGTSIRAAGNETVTGTKSFSSGSTAKYVGTGTYTSLALGNSYYNLHILGAGNFTHNAALTADEIYLEAGTFNSAGNDITTRNFESAGGTYVPGANTVTLSGTASNLIGNNTFNNLTKVTAAPSTITFDHSSTQTIGGVLTLTGSAGNVLSLRSSTSGQRFEINPQGTRSIAYLDVQDSNNTNALRIQAYGTNSTDSGNNVNWNFAANSAPVAVADTFTVNQDASATTLSVTANDTDSNGDPLTVTAATDPAGGTTAVNAGVLTYTPDSGFNGVDTFTYTVSDGTTTANGTVTVKVMNPFTWTGASTGPVSPNWSNNSNWHGGTAPTNADVAIFDATCSSNCSPTIDASINVAGVRMNSGYTGTITQAASQTITVGASGWSQSAGTFSGGDSALTINDGTFTLTGGTFTAPNANMTIDQNAQPNGTVFTVGASGAFNAPNGTLIFTGDNQNSVATIDLAPVITVNNLKLHVDSQFGYTRRWTLGSGDEINVTGNLEIVGEAGKTGKVIFNTGTINLNGNLTLGHGANGGSGKIRFTGPAAQTYTSTGTSWAGVLEVDKVGGTVTRSGGDNLLVVEEFRLVNGSFQAPTGTMTIDRVFNVGNSDAFYQASGTTFDPNGGLLRFLAKATHDAYYIDVPTTATFHNVTFDVSTTSTWTPNFTLGAGDTITVNDLTILRSASNGTVFLDGTRVDVQGNLSIQDGSGGGTAAIRLTGTAAQTINHAGGTVPGGTFTIDKASGTVTLASALSLDTVGQDLAITTGTLDLAGYNLTVNDRLELNAATSRLRLQGDETVTRTTFSQVTYAEVEYYGTGTYASLALGNTYQKLYFTGAGSWQHTGTLSSRDVTINAGATLISAGQDVQCYDNWNNYGTYTPGSNTFTLNASVDIRGNTTFNNLSHVVASAATLRFAAGSTQTIAGALTLQGAAGNLLSLRSLTPGTQFNINPQGSRTIAYLDVRDSNNTNALRIQAYGTNSTDSGNNTNWNFAANSAPVAVADTFTIDQDAAATTLDVKANDTDSNGDPLTVTAATDPAGGTTSVVAGVLTYTPDSGFNGVDTFTYTVSDGTATDTETVTIKVMNPFTWDGGGGDASWTTGANWHGNAAPSATQTAIFDATCSSNCSPTISAAVSVGGIRMNSGYGGTITHSGTGALTIGTGNWTQAAGTFTSTASGNVVLDNATFTLSGGSFTKSDGRFNMNLSDTTVADGATIFSTAAGGTFSFTGTYFEINAFQTRNYVFDFNSSLTVPQVVLDTYSSATGTTTFTFSAGDELIATAGLTLRASYNSDLIVNGGTIKDRGYFYAEGSRLKGGTTLISIDGTGAQEYKFQSASSLIGPFEVNKSAGALTPQAGTTILSVSQFTLTQGSFTAPSGTLTINRENAASSNAFVMAGGTFTHNSGTVKLTGTSGAATYTIDVPTSVTLNHLTFDTVNATADTKTFEVAAGDTVNVAGNLSVSRSSGTGLIALNGAYNVAGNLTVGTGASGGTAALTLNGTGAQSITHSGGTMPSGTFTVNKASGDATLASNLVLNSAGQDLVVTSGGFIIEGHDLTVNDRFDVTSDFATVYLLNSETVTYGSFNMTGGEVRYRGTGSYTGLKLGNNYSGELTFQVGTYTLNGTLTASLLSINNSATLNANGQILNVGSYLGLASNSTFNHQNSTVNMSLNGGANNLSGNWSFYNLTIDDNHGGAVTTLSFDAGTTVTVAGALSITGDVGNATQLRSTSPGTRWNINPQGTRTISWLDVQDSNNTNATYINAYNTNSTNSGNNVGWNFAANVAPVAVDDAIDMNQSDGSVVINVLSNDTDTNGDYLTVTAKTNGVSGTVTIAGDGRSVTYTPTGGAAGRDAFTYTVSDGQGGTDTGTVTVDVMTPYTWTGLGGNTNWSNGANWHNGTTAPGVNDVAIFSAVCDTTCNATIDTNVSVQGMGLTLGYTGTITQGAGYTVDIGSSDYIQYNGTFTGGNSNFTVTDGQFTLVGGTFTAPSATLKFQKTTEADAYAFQHLGGTFNHNSGTVWFDYNGSTAVRSYTVDGIATTTFNHLRFSAGHATTGVVAVWYIPAGDSLTVVGNLTIDRSGTTGFAALNETAVTGELKVRGNVSYLQGAYAGTATVTLDGTGTQYYFGHAEGQGPYLKINKTAGSVLPDAGTVNFNVTKFILTQGSFTAPTGDFGVGPGIWWSGNETMFQVASGTTYTHNSGRLILYGQSSSNAVYTIDLPTSLTINNLLIDGGRASGGTNNDYTIAAGDTLTANNVTLRQTTASGVVRLYGNLNVTGNLTTEAGFDGGTAAITLTGTAAQMITHSGGTMPAGTFTINKSSGTATLASALTLNGTGQDLAITSGTLALAGNNVSITDQLTSAAAGTLTLQGGETVSSASKSFSGTVVYNGSGTYASLAAGDSYNTLTFDGSGTWTLAGATTTVATLNLTQGTLKGGSSTIALYGNWNKTGGTFDPETSWVRPRGTNQTIYGDNTFTNFQPGPLSANLQLNFEAGKTQTITNTLNFGGNASATVTLRSTSAGTQWNIDPQGTRTVAYVNVRDSNNVNATAIGATAGTNTDAGNNTNWTFVNLGTFAITGATGGTDNTANAWLGTTTTLTANWQTSTNATSYDVQVRNSGDTDWAEAGDSAACSENSVAATSYTFTGCTLVHGTSYIIKVTAKAGSTVLPASNNSYSFTVDTSGPANFNITGATGGADVTANAYLTAGTDVTANWENTTGESSYLVSIRDGSNNELCTEGAETPAADTTSQAFTGCSLADNTDYYIQVVAYDTAGNATAATNSLYQFRVDRSAPALAFTSPAASSYGQTGVTIEGTCEGTLTVNISGTGH
ncbi:MAG TPA: Ig-like domain-containing protein, partial [Bdellovibrionales bacterium]|nr:Ig-like domain-containing protein [Bdellovibrionales bacterium]